MKKFVMVAMIGLGFVWVSCASVGDPGSLLFPDKDENGNPIDWEKEIEAYNADPNNEIKIICKEVTPTGSHIPVMRCQTETQQENRQRQDQEWLERFLRHSG